MDVGAFVESVRAAEDDAAVGAAISASCPEKEQRLLNLRLRRVTVKDVPEDLRESFERFYGADLPADKRVFDLLEEDDVKAFGPK
jgi:hypothetical protein